jgi:RHS repeat-associated protein
VGDRLQQTVNGSPTRYVLDPAAGLTQVLADGTSTYLYGNDRLAQYQAAMQYFGPDALGSVRQLFDSGGQVVGSSRYDPYGNVMSQSGTATSVFAFAGEQQDATGLTYLRARYYSSAQGRFTTRDVWEGDPNAPMSYSAWLYVYGNPVNGIDPTGREPTTGGIDAGDYSYSCNCGWIDWGHASPGNARALLGRVYRDPPRMPGYLEGYKVVAAGAHTFFNLGVDRYAVVRTGLSLDENRRVALGIFEDINEQFESWQGSVPLGGWQLGTMYAEEDLASDLIGFHAAVEDIAQKGERGFKEGLSPEQLKALVRPVCGVPVDLEGKANIVEQRDQAWSLSVLNEPYGPFEKVRTWGSPRLKGSCLIDGACGYNRGWPAKYSTITPEPPMTNGKWWWWRGIYEDGQLLGSSLEGVSYLGTKVPMAPAPLPLKQ